MQKRARTQHQCLAILGLYAGMLPPVPFTFRSANRGPVRPRQPHQAQSLTASGPVAVSEMGMDSARCCLVVQMDRPPSLLATADADRLTRRFTCVRPAAATVTMPVGRTQLNEWTLPANGMRRGIACRSTPWLMGGWRGRCLVLAADPAPMYLQSMPHPDGERCTWAMFWA
jgi:hypothetical protein